MATSEQFIRDYVEALRDDNAAVFAGAGLSIPSGLVDWVGLIREIAADVDLNVDKEHDLISVAQYHVNERGGRHRINQALVSEFAERAQTSENHALLAALPINTYWTTNYDHLIEDALRTAKKRPDVKISPKNLTTNVPRRDAVVYKLHGDVSLPDEAIVIRDDYETFMEKRGLFSTALQGDLLSKTFLFIGFSFSDPNLGYVLGRIRTLFGSDRREHYALMRRVQAADFSTNDEHIYARTRQEIQARDLKRYGIQCVFTASYGEYTDVLREVHRRYRSKRCFVSGSAAAYDPWTEQQAQEFLRMLGRQLIENGFDLVTGFGKGVGPYVLNGALEGLDQTGSASIHDRITLRPFPQGVVDPELRWNSYRRDMMKGAGVAVLIFGNRGVAGSTELAAGVELEFEIARELGLKVVPVGATGSMAQRLHERVLSDFDSYYPKHHDLRLAFRQLATTTDPVALVDQVIAFVRKLES
jgi:hypothetical protein